MGTTTFQTPSQAGVSVVRCARDLAVREPSVGGSAGVGTTPAGAMAGTAAPFTGTGLPAALRLRVPGTALAGSALAGTAPAPVSGIDVPLSGRPLGAARTTHNSSTPGDLPPRDPLS